MPDAERSKVDTVTDLIADPSTRVQLHDMFADETDSVLAATGAGVMSVDVRPFDADVYARHVTDIEAATADLNAMVMTAAFFADHPSHDRALLDVIERLAGRPFDTGGNPLLIRLQRLPALTALYSLGIGAVAGRRVDPLALALAQIEIVDGYRRVPLVEGINVYDTLDADAIIKAFKMPRHAAPQSVHMQAVLGKAAAGAVRVDERRFIDVFDDVEYLLGLAAADAKSGWPPVGQFAWRRRGEESGRRDAIVAVVADDLLGVGMFGRSADQLEAARSAFEEHINKRLSEARFG